MDPSATTLTQTLTGLESDGASGVLTIVRDGTRTEIGVAHGRLVLPDSPELDDDRRATLYGHGFDAEDAAASRIAAIDDVCGTLAEAMQDPSSQVSFLAGSPAEGSSIPTATAVQDARRRQAESERLAIQVPGDDAVPDRIRGATAGSSHLSRFLGTCFAAVDGSRSLTELATDLHVDLLTVRRAVFRLSTLGLVRFDRAVAADPSPAPGLTGDDWATDSLAEAIEEPEPWIGYAKGNPDVPPPSRSRPTPAEPHSVVRQAEADEAVPVTPDPAPSLSTVAPNRQRPLNEGERRESLREAAAWLADIDHDDAPPEPEPAAAPATTAADEPDEPADFAAHAPPAEDVSDFLRELSQLSRDDD